MPIDPMTKRAAWAYISAMLLAGCSPQSDRAQDNAAADDAASRYVDKMAGTPPPAPAAKPFRAEEKGKLLEFVYAYPAQAAAVPALVDSFGKAMATSKADATAMAKEDQKAARQSGFPFRAHSLETEWSVSADTPHLLALRSQTYVFTGGAHGMTGYETLLWDKARGREMSVRAVMTSSAAFGAAIRDRFCAELDVQRASKRGAPVVRSDDEFTKCINPMDQALALTSKDGKLIDGVTVIVGPYSAGPYSEGSYDVELPVDATMLKAIKPDYQDAFVKR